MKFHPDVHVDDFLARGISKSDKILIQRIVILFFSSLLSSPGGLFYSLFSISLNDF